jgi:hypothetical protein
MGTAKSPEIRLSAGVDGSYLTFRTLVRPVMLYLDRFLLARGSFVRAKSDVGKFKIAVGAANANGLKCPGF